jgi:hypothetical protein
MWRERGVARVLCVVLFSSIKRITPTWHTVACVWAAKSAKCFFKFGPPRQHKGKSVSTASRFVCHLTVWDEERKRKKSFLSGAPSRAFFSFSHHSLIDWRRRERKKNNHYALCMTNLEAKMHLVNTHVIFLSLGERRSLDSFIDKKLGALLFKWETVLRVDCARGARERRKKLFYHSQRRRLQKKTETEKIKNKANGIKN